MKIGDYVAYIPKSGEYTASAERSGYTSTADLWHDALGRTGAFGRKKLYSKKALLAKIKSERSIDQIFRTEEDIKWRILSISANKVTIASENGLKGGTKDGLVLQGARGYNHSVELLHDLCKALYSNPKKRITARSIVQEDICYPAPITNIERKYSNGCIPGILSGKNDGYTREKIFLLSTGETEYRLPDKYDKELIITYGGYWLASRGVYILPGVDDGAEFVVCKVFGYLVGKGDKGATTLFTTKGKPKVYRAGSFIASLINTKHEVDRNEALPVRPVVTLSLDSLKPNTGTKDNPHTLKV
jgi:hypothetical protein